MDASPETLPGNPGGSIICVGCSMLLRTLRCPERSIPPEVAGSVHQSKLGASNQSTFALSRHVEGTEVTGAHNQSRVQPWDTRERAGQVVSWRVDTYIVLSRSDQVILLKPLLLENRKHVIRWAPVRNIRP